MIEVTEAYHIHLSADSRAYLARAIACRAMSDARNKIKDQIKAEGRKLSEVPPNATRALVVVCALAILFRIPHPYHLSN
jgi:hypothetical protein